MKLYAIVITLYCFGANAADLYVGNCPILTPATIGEAACSTPSKPYAAELDDKRAMRALVNYNYEKFYLPKRDGVQFVATTPCPSGIWKKFFQSHKEYRPIKEENLKEGKAFCSYPLNGDLQFGRGHVRSKRLQDKVGIESVRYFVGLPTIHQANAWSGSFRGWVEDSTDSLRVYELSHQHPCPVLTSQMLKKREFSKEYRSWREEQAILTFHATDGAKILSTLSGLLGGDILYAHAILGEPFEVSCTYRIHPGGRGEANAKEIVLFGTNGKL